MPDVMTQYSTVSADTPGRYVARRTYELAERNMVLGRYATRYQLPQRMSTTLRAVRVGRLNLPTGPLTEGVAPDSVALSITNADVTLQQWGIVVLLTDIAEITTVHPMLRAAIERTALAMAEMFEREMAETLMAGTSVTFAGAQTTRAGLTAMDASTGELIGVVTALRRRGAIPIRGTLYGGCMPPQVEADMMDEAAFQNAVARGQDLERLDFAKIGNWMGVEWVRSNFLPFFRGVAAPDGAAATATKAQLTAIAGATWTGAAVTVVVVGRATASDYERLISLQGTLDNTAPNGNIRVATPTGTAYVYDIYVSDTAAGTGTNRLAASRVANTTTRDLTALPAGTAAAAPALIRAAADEVFVTWVFGRDAFGRVELDGMSLQSYLTPAGASYSNPLAQGRKIGNKVMWNSWLLDNDFFERFESNADYPAGLP